MSDEPLPRPDDDTVPPGDPFEAELVAYLDGELDDATARKVEMRLATDPAARRKAAALKKTFDLLDYLPRPEPSADFTTRTLDKLPAMKTGPVPVQTPPGSRPAAQPVLLPSSVSSSVPVALATGALAVPPARPGRWPWAVGVLVAVTGFAVAGYFGAAALRSDPATAGRDPAADELPLSDQRLVEHLPLYSAADDIEFVQKLAEPDLFGDEPAVSFEATPAVPAVEPDKPSGPAFETLAKAFKALPPARQQAVRELDKQLHAQAPATRDRFLRVLEAYAVWLDRLPEAERKRVLAAAAPGPRLGVIREVRERQWLDSMPALQRSQLAGLTAAKRAELIGEWRRAEAERREEWADVRRNADAIAANQIPWPFDAEPMRKSVAEYMRATFKTDEPKKSRLTANELDRYTAALATAEESDGWAWYAYGREVVAITRKYERFLLPEPADPKMRYDDFRDLPSPFAKVIERPGLKKKLSPHVGKWPDFPLELHDELRMIKGLPPLGPAKASDFKEPIRTFWEKELSPKLTGQERGGLRMLENRWPEYPRRFLELARNHDLSVPGLTLPGSPRRWDRTYGPRFPGGPGGKP
jgi:hypothetical protein